MSYKGALFVSLIGAGFAITFGCTADLRNLNGCRAVTSAVCERNRECDPVGFDASFASLDACIDSFLTVLGKGSMPTGNDKCGPITTDCLDEIEVAACGKTTMLTKCGVVRSIRPGRSGSTSPSPSNSQEAGASDGGTDIPPLTSAAPDILELRQGVLVACRAGEGCRSSAGDTYGGKTKSLVSFAVDSLRNIFGVDGQRVVTMITPSGMATNIGGPWDFAFSLPTSRSEIGAAFTRGSEAFFVVSPGQTNASSATSFGKTTAPISGIAAVSSGVAIYADGQLSICGPGGGCSLSMPVSFPSGIRGVEGAYAGSRFVAIEQGRGIWSDGMQGHGSTNFSDCADAVVGYDDTIGCITTAGTFRVDDVLVPGASGVAKIAIDASDVYWVTNAGRYHHASRSSLLTRDH